VLNSQGRDTGQQENQNGDVTHPKGRQSQVVSLRRNNAGPSKGTPPDTEGVAQPKGVSRMPKENIGSGQSAVMPRTPGDQNALSRPVKMSGKRTNPTERRTDTAVSDPTAQSTHVLSQQLPEPTLTVPTPIRFPPDYVTGQQEGIINRGLIANGGCGDVYSVLLLDLNYRADILIDG
jgi:hypothetical protein